MFFFVFAEMRTREKKANALMSVHKRKTTLVCKVDVDLQYDKLSHKHFRRGNIFRSHPFEYECVFDKKLFAAVIKCFIDNWTCVKKEKFPEEYDFLEDCGSFGMASKQMVVICLDNIHFSLFLTHY